MNKLWPCWCGSVVEHPPTGPSQWTCSVLVSSNLCLLQNSSFSEGHHRLPNGPSQKSGQTSPLLRVPSPPHRIINHALCDDTFRTPPTVHPPLASRPVIWSRPPSSLTCSSAITSWVSSCLQGFVNDNPFFSLQPEWPFLSINLIRPLSSPPIKPSGSSTLPRVMWLKWHMT